MTLPVDPLEALLTHLRADADLTALVGTRIYGADRPPVAADGQPSTESGAAVSASLAGGTPHPDLPLADVLIDVIGWGGTGPDGPLRAVSIWRAVHATVNVAHRVSGAAHLLWAVEEQGPTLLRDPDTNEAFVRATLRVATANAQIT